MVVSFSTPWFARAGLAVTLLLILVPALIFAWGTDINAKENYLSAPIKLESGPFGGYAYHKVHNPGVSILTLNKDTDSLKMFAVSVSNGIKSYGVQELVPLTYSYEVADKCTLNYTCNTVVNLSCSVKSNVCTNKTVTDYSTEWRDTDKIVLLPGDTKDTRFKFVWNTGVFKSPVQVDYIPQVASNVYSEYAWYNVSCGVKRNISFSGDLYGTETFKFVLTSAYINYTNTFNATNITFVNAAENKMLDYVIGYVNNSKNSNQQIEAFVNMSGLDSIYMYSDCNFNADNGVYSTGKNPAMIFYNDYSNGITNSSCTGSIIQDNTTATYGRTRTSFAYSWAGAADCNLASFNYTDKFRNFIWTEYFFKMTDVQGDILTCPSYACGIGASNFYIKHQDTSWVNNGVTALRQYGTTSGATYLNFVWLSNYSAPDVASSMLYTETNGTLSTVINQSAYRNSVKGYYYLVHRAGAAGTMVIDEVKVWAQNPYTNVSIGFLENSSGGTPSVPAFECVNNTLTYDTLTYEHDSYVSTFNVTYNATNVSSLDVTFFYGNVNYSGGKIESYVTPNGTAQNNIFYVANYNASIVNVNGTPVNGVWVVNCLLNNGSTRKVSSANTSQAVSLAYSVEHINYTTPIYEATPQYYYYNLSRYGTTLKNVSIILTLNGSVYNATLGNTSVLVNGWNNTRYNISAVAPLSWVNNSLHQFSMDATLVYSNGSYKSLSFLFNQTEFFSYVPGPRAANDLIEGDKSVINSTLKIIGSPLASVAGYVDFNASLNYSAALIFSNATEQYYQLNYSWGLIEPVSLSLLVNYTPWFNISLGGLSVQRNSTNFNFTVYKMWLSNCTPITAVNNVSAFNISLLDEVTLAGVTGDIDFSLTVYKNQAFNRTYGLTYQNLQAASICAYPNLTFTGIGSAEYSATGYSTRTTVFTPFSITTIPSQLLKFYLLNVSTSTKISLSVVDELNKGVQNAIIKILKKDLGTGALTLVDSPSTGPGGTTASYLEMLRTYNWLIYTSDGVLRKNETFALTDSSYTFKIQIGDIININDFISVGEVWNNLTCLNSTLSARLLWNDTANVLSNICLQAINVSSGIWSNASSFCSVNDSGIITLGPLVENNSYMFMARGYNGSKIFILDSCSLDTHIKAGVMDKEGVFWSIMILLVIEMLGVMFGPLIGLFLIIPWFVFVLLTGLLHLGTAALIGFIAVVGLLMVLWKR